MHRDPPTGHEYTAQYWTLGHVETLGTKQCDRLYNTSMMEDHMAALICFIDRKATFLQQQWL